MGPSSTGLREEAAHIPRQGYRGHERDVGLPENDSNNGDVPTYPWERLCVLQNEADLHSGGGQNVLHSFNTASPSE